MNLLYIILIALALIFLWVVYLYNNLIALKNHVDESWSDIDVQLKRRYDLIPNIVEAVRGYMRHEAQVLQKITEARTTAMGAKTLGEKAEAENILSQTLKSLFAVTENYPNLKASENFLQLQDELSDAENKIQAARRFYNSNVRDYNIKIQQFPNNLLAKTLRFGKQDYFEISAPTEREAPKVQI